jgi:hypothetical protein
MFDAMRSRTHSDRSGRGVESTLTAIMGPMAMDRGREVTWEETLALE